MIIEYNKIYNNDIKNLFLELQEYISSIDKEGYNIITPNYKDTYFKKTLNDLKKYNGKMYLYIEKNKLLGLIVGIINNEEINTYDFKAPKRGRITELIVSKNVRTNGIGSKLMNKMEKYLKSIGCVDILIEVFGYNETAIKFYNKNNYYTRMIEMTKKLD